MLWSYRETYAEVAAKWAGGGGGVCVNKPFIAWISFF